MWQTFLTTVAASAIGAAIAGALGIKYGLTKLRREKAFEKRLSWYETTIADLSAAVDSLQQVTTAARAGDGNSGFAALVNAASPVLRRAAKLKTEARMYASESAYEAMCQAAEDIDVLLNTAGALKDKKVRGEDAPVRLVEICAKLIRHAIQRLADDFREHLQLEPLPVFETGIYDREYREHLKDLEDRGMWPTEEESNDQPKLGGADSHP